MSLSYSNRSSHTSSLPVSALMYRDVATPLTYSSDAREADVTADDDSAQKGDAGPTPEQIDALLDAARVSARAEAEERLRQEYNVKEQEGAAKIRLALEAFQSEQRTYFAKVEAEVVSLALAIAGKILHREAQVDPSLIAALVRVAIEKLHDGSIVSVRVAPEQAEKWRQYMASPLNGTTVHVVEDGHLGPADCVLETDLGSANFSIDAQLKEVEQGFFDLLSQRPSLK